VIGRDRGLKSVAAGDDPKLSGLTVFQRRRQRRRHPAVAAIDRSSLNRNLIGQRLHFEIIEGHQASVGDLAPLCLHPGLDWRVSALRKTRISHDNHRER
jgi:hypothetical protein